MRVEVDYVRQGFEIIRIALAVGGQLSRNSLLRFRQANRFATPTLSQGPIMITDNRRKPIIVNEEIEHFAILFTFDY
jgi:hypothetical protein